MGCSNKVVKEGAAQLTGPRKPGVREGAASCHSRARTAVSCSFTHL